MMIMMTASANMWYQSAWLENKELGSELHDPGKIRMKKMKNKHRKRRETNSDSDHISPRLRAIAIMKQEIAIMELQYEIALLEKESRRLEDIGDKGKVITPKEENRSRIHDYGHTRMKRENKGYGDGQESNPDRTTPRSREFAEWKQEILIKLEYRIELLEQESEGRQGETGEFENLMSSELILQETGESKKKDEEDEKDNEKKTEDDDKEEEESGGYNRNRSPESVTEIVDRNHDILFFKNDIRRQKHMIYNESSVVKMKEKRTHECRERKGKNGFPFLATTVSDKRRKIATEDRLATERLLATKNRLATERFSGTELALTTVQRLSATKWEMSNNITILGITKQFMADLCTHYDKFKEKAFYRRRRRDESLRMLSLGDGVRIKLSILTI
ncbi:hypothetical protein Hanom_Chr10g00919221 [Helianthus anomalus]